MPRNKRVAIIGTWQSEKAAPYKTILQELGKLVAEKGYEIVCGAGSTGVFAEVLPIYKENNGKKITVFLPKLSDMKKVGEKKYVGADVYVPTNASYPVRNSLMVEKADALVAVAGGLGSLGEIIAGYKDFHKPVFVYNSKKVKKIAPDCYDFLQSIPELKKGVKTFSTVQELSKLLAK
jgi:uncharacterized protein (TIGR00725 family)